MSFKQSFLFFLFIFIIFAFPQSIYAYSVPVDSTTKFSDFTSNDMVEYFTSKYNCNNFVLYENPTYYYFIPLFDNSYTYVKTSNNNLQSYIYFHTMNSSTNTNFTYRITKNSFVERTPMPQNNYTTAYFSNSNYTMIYSTLDIINQDDDTTWFTKNYNYTPTSCPTCEECEECDNMNIDFPISKEEFYVLLVLLSTILIMLFFKWTFSDKRRRR